MTFTPAAATEWDEPVIRDCTFASGLMLSNKATLGAHPTTRPEREAIARAAGKPEGFENATLQDLASGLNARYSWSGRILEGAWTAFLAALVPGVGAVIQGYYSALPVHFARFDPNFAAKGNGSYHAMYVERRADGSLWLIDPLFHGVTGYTGEPIAAAQLAPYATAYGSPARAMLATEGEAVPIATVTLTPFEAPRTFRVAAGATVKGYRPDSPTPVKTETFPVASSATADAQAAIVQSPNAAVIPHGSPFLRVATGDFKGLYIPGSSVTLDPAPAIPAPPDPTPFSQADVDAAKKAGMAVGREKQHQVDEAALAAAPTA